MHFLLDCYCHCARHLHVWRDVHVDRGIARCLDEQERQRQRGAARRRLLAGALSGRRGWRVWVARQQVAKRQLPVNGALQAGLRLGG